MKGDSWAQYTLGDDIDASAIAVWNDGNGFDPIEEVYDPFTGSFDGDGHTISNLISNPHRTVRASPFGLVQNSVVKQ
jgi:hypothetical protein